MENKISAVKLWFKLAWQFKTPFVFPMDTIYYPITEDQLLELYDEFPHDYKWIPEVSDCDDAAFVFKGIASRHKINAIGVVTGKGLGGAHAWNCVLLDKGIVQFEPQNGKIVKYRPMAVVI